MANADDLMNVISTAELERRWAAMHAQMDEQDIDILSMAGVFKQIKPDMKNFELRYSIGSSIQPSQFDG
jgi:hypothetical protein